MGLMDRIPPWRWRWRIKDTAAGAPARWFVDWVRGGEPTLSGVHVDGESAMRLSAVWACVRVRSEDIAKIPCILYRRLPGGGKRRATEHPLYNLVNFAPNGMQTAFEFRQMMQANVDLHGNAFAIKEFDTRGNIIALWPICPHRVKVMVTPNLRDLFYEIHWQNMEKETYPADDIVHLRGVTVDGISGLSPIGYHRETIGLAIAERQYGAAFFGNSAQPLGAIEVPGIVPPETAVRLRESWEQRHRGVDRAHKIAIFDGGMKWVSMGLNNVDSQYIESRNLQNSEIWRIYRVPAHKVGDLTKATFSNIEMQSLEYVTDCLLTEMRRWEQTLYRDLLTTFEQRNMFFEFLPDALLRGDIKSRYEAYAIGRNWGWLSANDVRDKENWNKIPNGDVYLQPLNMIEAGDQPEPPETPSEDSSEQPSGESSSETMRRVIGNGMIKPLQ